MAVKVRGYKFHICKMAPNCDDQWRDCIMFMDYRDNIEDAQKIMDVLQETDINWTVYYILAEPVYESRSIADAGTR